ncbi:hypothetical protein MTO96_009715 [Rhipicephalus appendiculatus]
MEESPPVSVSKIVSRCMQGVIGTLNASTEKTSSQRGGNGSNCRWSGQKEITRGERSRARGMARDLQRAEKAAGQLRRTRIASRNRRHMESREKLGLTAVGSLASAAAAMCAARQNVVCHACRR